MSLLWCDGFDHYGLDENNMLDGPWAQVDSLHKLSTAVVRTGTHSMLRGQLGGSGVAEKYFRRVFGAAKGTVGVGQAVYPVSLPAASDRHILMQFTDAANANQITIVLQSTGAIAVQRGNVGGTLLATSAALMTAAAWAHLETKVTIDNSAGAVEVRLNNVTIIDISGVDTQATGNAETSQVRWGVYTNLTLPLMYLEDIFAWDTAGSYNNDFIGDHQVLTLWPNGDTAQSDWTRNTGATDYGAIDEADPDDDATYVEATAAAQISEYALDDLPATVSAIAAVQLTGRMKKTDAGAAKVRQSLVSGASEFNGADRNITTEYSYWPDISEQDPATGAPWTRTALNAALYKIERTA